MGKLPNKTKKPALVIANCSVLTTVRWTVNEIHIYSVQQEKKWTNRKKYMINYFSFNYNSRIIQEYFQAKIGKKVRTFSLAQKNNIFIVKKSLMFFFLSSGRLYIAWRILCSLGVSRKGANLTVMCPWAGHGFQGLGTESFTGMWRLDVSSVHLWYQKFFLPKNPIPRC